MVRLFTSWPAWTKYNPKDVKWKYQSPNDGGNMSQTFYKAEKNPGRVEPWAFKMIFHGLRI
jgi:hypothetical protein